MKRKWIIVFFIAVLLLSITGCSVNKKKESSVDNSTAKNSTEVKEQDQAAGKETEENKKGEGPESQANQGTEPLIVTNYETDDEAAPAVYMTKNISPEGLVKIYEALGRKAKGKVAVKVHMGEPGGNNYLNPDLIKDLVTSVKGTFVDSNTAYGGLRTNTAAHMQVAEDHGFTAYTSVDILDSEGDVSLPIKNGEHLKEDLVGSHYKNYDFIIVLSHFKGHAIGGFGGAIKNMAIGFATPAGKNLIHNAGGSDKNIWVYGNYDQDAFLESMAEAAEAITDDAKDNILYINVMNNLSIDCDCDPSPAAPEMEDIGIFASLDPVALDRACVDQVYAADIEKSASLRRRIESRHGTHTFEYAEQLGIGSQKYKLVTIDE